MSKKRFCVNNKEALRWCAARKVVIQFANWRAIKKRKNIPEGITCSVSLGRLVKIDKTNRRFLYYNGLLFATFWNIRSFRCGK